MILNIIDRRQNAYRWTTIDVVIEATSHDNAIPGADPAFEDNREPGFTARKGVSLTDAVAWASSFDAGLTLYLYDSGSDAVPEWSAADWISN